MSDTHALIAKDWVFAMRMASVTDLHRRELTRVLYGRQLRHPFVWAHNPREHMRWFRMRPWSTMARSTRKWLGQERVRFGTVPGTYMWTIHRYDLLQLNPNFCGRIDTSFCGKVNTSFCGQSNKLTTISTESLPSILAGISVERCFSAPQTNPMLLLHQNPPNASSAPGSADFVRKRKNTTTTTASSPQCQPTGRCASLG